MIEHIQHVFLVGVVEIAAIIDMLRLGDQVWHEPLERLGI